MITISPDKVIRAKIELDDELKLYDYLIQIDCILSNRSLPYAERTILCYYAKWGINKETEERYIKDFNRSRQIASNLKYQLTKRGFLYKHPDLNAHELPPFLKKKRDELTIILELKCQN